MLAAMETILGRLMRANTGARELTMMLIATCVLLLSLPLGILHAAETTIVSYEPPFSELPNQSKEVKSDQNWGQTFSYDSPGATYEVDKIGLVLYRASDASSQTITVSIRSSWNGAAITSGTISSTSLLVGNSWATIDLSSTAILNDNASYYIRVTTDTTNGKIYLGIDESGTYSDGSAIDKDGNVLPGNDAAFRIIDFTEPEVDVSGLGVSIADGDATPDAADDTDFGSLDITTGTNANTFTITNTGAAVLNLSGTPRVTIGGVDAADFTLTTDAASSVAASGGTSTFTITFDPSAVGVRSATVSIANDDADENPYNFSIEGTGTASPEMAVSKSADVASVNNAGDVITYTITLTNTGVVTITGITVSDPVLTGLSCTPGTGVNPSDMAPAAVASCTGTYTVTQADFDNNGGGDSDIDNIVTVTANGGLSETAGAAVTLNINPVLTVNKTADDTTQVVVGQVITYTYVVTNNGNLTISDVFLNDMHNGSGPAPVPSNESLTTDTVPLGDSVDAAADGIWDKLAPGDNISFTASYTVTQSDIDTLQ